MQLRLLDRLGEPHHDPRRAQFVVVVQAERRHHDERDAGERRIGLDRPCQHHAVDLGHLAVEDREVVLELQIGGGVQRRERLSAAADADRRHAPGGQLVVEDAAVGRVVVHDEHAASGHRRHDGQGRLNGGGPLLEPCREPERRSLSLDAAHADLAVHQLDEPPRDGEAQAGPAELARRRTVSLGEGFEQERLHARGHADPGVSHLDADDGVGRRLALE